MSTRSGTPTKRENFRLPKTISDDLLLISNLLGRPKTAIVRRALLEFFLRYPDLHLQSAVHLTHSTTGITLEGLDE